MGNMRRLYDDIIKDYESEVFTIEQLEEKYNDIPKQSIIDTIDYYERHNKD